MITKHAFLGKHREMFKVRTPGKRITANHVVSIFSYNVSINLNYS